MEKLEVFKIRRAFLLIAFFNIVLLIIGKISVDFTFVGIMFVFLTGAEFIIIYTMIDNYVEKREKAEQKKKDELKAVSEKMAEEIMKQAQASFTELCSN